MSLITNNKFIKAFNELDNILKDMYASDIPSKLGVTRYLEDMRANELMGMNMVVDWKSDYRKLKQLRDNRNKAIHENMLDSDVFDDIDIKWIVDFKNRVLSQTDPLSKLHKIKNESIRKNFGERYIVIKNKRDKNEDYLVICGFVVLFVILLITYFFIFLK